MSENFLGEIRIFGFNFAPKNWALCNGQTMQISQNSALFALLGTTYGGNGTSTFLLPNLQGRTPFNFYTSNSAPPGSQNMALGQMGGEEYHTLTVAETPIHSHQAYASSGAVATPNPAPNAAWTAQSANAYSTTAPNVTMAPNALGLMGGGQPHPNLSPFLVVNFCIALSGIFPTRN